jgi:3-hydroxyisobutyrate dehydrogenase-like beta-hydroxyacid dehydrogenase
MNDPVKPVVGFIGLGVMGAAMAMNIRTAGYRLVVHDLRRASGDPHVASGATWVDTPRAVAEAADVVFTCLPGLAQIDAVMSGPDGVLAGIKAGQAVFEMSTSSPEQVQRLHAEFARQGAHFLDAPVSGGARGARQAQLGIWVGGDAAVFDRYAAVLLAMGDRPVHVGPVGSGLVTKLVHNVASQVTQAAIVEAFVLGVKAGAEPRSLWQAIRGGAIGRRRTFDGLADEFLPGRYEGRDAALRIVHKDIKTATELAEDLGVPMRLAGLALDDLEEAMRRGWSERDCRLVMLLPQQRAGVDIQVDAAAIEEVLRGDPRAATDPAAPKTR